MNQINQQINSMVRLELQNNQHRQKLDKIKSRQKIPQENLLRKDIDQFRQMILKQIYDKFQIEYQSQLINIENKAQQQYKQAQNQLQNQAKEIRRQKAEPIQKQIGKQKHYNMKQRNKKYQQLHKEYIQHLFADNKLILNSSQIIALQRDLYNNIKNQYKNEYNQQKQKKKQQILIKQQRKYKKKANKVDKQLKQIMQNQSGICFKRGQLENQRNLLAALKSQYNVKINRYGEDIKKYQAMISQIQKDSNNDCLQSLSKELSILKQNKQHEKQLAQQNLFIKNKQQILNQQNYLPIHQHVSKYFNINKQHLNKYHLSTQQESHHASIQITDKNRCQRKAQIYDCCEDSLQLSNYQNQQNQQHKPINMGIQKYKSLRNILRYHGYTPKNKQNCQNMQNSVQQSHQRYNQQTMNSSLRHKLTNLLPKKNKSLSMQTRRTIISNICKISDIS